MKKFVFLIFLFFVAVGAIDCGFGAACTYMMKNAVGGFTRTHEYIAHKCKEDILIFGSSRAIHHYDPAIISDSLHMSCYNCGMDGNGILYLYSRFLMVKNRYTPKLIIYDVAYGYDLKTDDHTRYLGWQKRYCEIPGVMDVISDIAPLERLKLKSNLYRYNGFFLQMMSDNIHVLHEINDNGYQPLHSVMDYEPKIDTPGTISWDPIKKRYFEKLVADCRNSNIQLVVAYSPQYSSVSSDVYSEITNYCKSNDIILIDHYADSYYKKKDWFADSSHLNDTGAKEYTRNLMSEIKSLLHL